MQGNNNRHSSGIRRRAFTKIGGLSAFGALAGCTTARGQDESSNDSNKNSSSDTSTRITSAKRVSPRDFHEENYEITHTYRRNEALRVLLQDPKANKIARNWIGSFEAYAPLTNTLGTISVQGCPDYTANGSFDKGSWDITAKNRQTIYGLVDRRHNELVALQITDPMDIQWKEEYEKKNIRRGRVLYDQPEVKEYLKGKDWWPSIKVGESITAGEGLRHGNVTIVLFPAVGKDSMGIVSGFLDVSEDKPKFVDMYFVDDFVRYSTQDLAREIKPNNKSVLGKVPDVPKTKRPIKTANKGYHRFETLPDKNFTDAGWKIHWEPPETMGVKLEGQFRGQPVFSAMNGMAPTTFTGYDLPPRKGRNTLNWFFPEHKPKFNGHHIFWDIHSISFGGPGALAKVDYPKRRDHPKGFQFRTHYHTGAQGRSSIDFHSGVRFGPYNYNISYEFFEDGRFIPIWRRHGPGYVTESLYGYGQPEDYKGEENVVQQYISAQAFDVTPGTRDGVEVQYFDGDSWSKPAKEFYKEGEPGTKLRFTNPNGSQTIDLPMDRGMEAVVLKRKSDEIGPAKSQAMRADDLDVELDYYHPAQYVDGDQIQNERVILWLLLEASMDEVPHPAGATAYAALAELQLKGY
ncbi:hypothetical protein [Halomicrococcus sp. NG-SE-24]|uniref:hypothetical protein n=1 Tax=Halomicrococcus sp. NG-SE-24 TaxID=3436928 RepID=UPI003D97B1C1